MYNSTRIRVIIFDTKHFNVRSKNEAGYALVSVLLLCALLASASVALTSLIDAQVLEARARTQEIRLAAAADSTSTLAALQLAARSGNGTTASLWTGCRWDDATSVYTRIQDHGGLLDINMANPDFLFALLMVLTRSEQRSRAVTDAILDHADPDTMARSGGAEPHRYPETNFGPKNAPFDTTLELDQVPGIDDHLLERLLALTTVHSQQQGADANAAPPDLRNAMVRGDGVRFQSPTAARVFSIDSTAVAGGSRFRTITIVSLLRQRLRPFAVIEWRRLGEVPDEIPGHASRPCLTPRSG